jgi:hypothetical protein
LNNEPPVAAKVGALRADFKEPCWGVARFNSYAQKTKEGNLYRNWATMSDVMIAKCAEALALRKAFPQELSGLYTPDEMAQAVTEEAPTPRTAPKIAPLDLAVPRDIHKPLADAQLQHDPETGEVREIDEPHPSDPDASAAPEGFDFGAAEEHPEESTTERIKQLDDALAIAAAKGTAALKEAWDEIERDDKLLMRAALQRRHKKTAAEADKATTG